MAIRCEEGPRHFSLIEGVDGYYVELQDKSGSLEVVQRLLPEGKKAIGVRALIPRVVSFGRTSAPACNFDEAEPFLFNCARASGEVKEAQLVTESGEKFTVPVNTFVATAEHHSIKSIPYGMDGATTVQQSVVLRLLVSRPVRPGETYQPATLSLRSFVLQGCRHGNGVPIESR